MLKTSENTTMSLWAESLPLLWQQEPAMSVASTSAVVLSKERQATDRCFRRSHPGAGRNENLRHPHPRIAETSQFHGRECGPIARRSPASRIVTMGGT